MKTLILVWALLVMSSVADEVYQVAFETTECSGEGGFATVGVDAIDRIKSAGCSVDGKKLMSMIVKKEGSYVTYTLSTQEAKSVMADVKAYMRARLEMLQRSTPVVITK